MTLFRLLSWPYLRRHLLRWTLTLAGIVLGVAVFVAMHSANRSIFNAFNQTIDRIAGATQLQVTAGEFGFGESVLETVQAVPEVGVAVPVIEAAVETTTAGQGSILLLGIDMTGDRSLRSYDLTDADEAIIDDPLVFLARPDSLIVTKEFAERNDIGVDGRVTLWTIEGEKAFTVRGIMSSEGLAQAFGGNLAVMDIYAAQYILGRGRRFDRIDIRAKDGVPVERCRAAVGRALGPGFEVAAPSARGNHFEALLQSYSATTSISSLFASLVGLFIIYNSFAIAVTHRRSEIGILRALGATRRQVQRLFLIESILAGSLGSAVGVALGLLGALTVARYVSVILQEAGGLAQRVTDLAIEPAVIGMGVTVGIGTSVLAAWIPARDAARVDPVQALQKGKYQVLSTGENRRRRRVALAFVTLSVICLVFSNSKPVFYAGYILMILSGLLLAPTLTLWLSRAGRPILRRLMPAEGTLAADSLVQAPRRTSATVAALMLSLAMVLGFRGVAQSFYTAFEGWMDGAMSPDFFVAGSANLTRLDITFPGELAPIIAGVEGVDQVQLVRAARVVIRGIPAMVFALEMNKDARTTARVPVAGSLDEMNRLTAEGRGTIASESFAFFRSMKMGDVVELPAPEGLLRLPIVGIVRDYSDMQGSLFIDRSVYSRWWADDTASHARVYVREGQDVAEVCQRVLDALAGRHRLFILTNHELREWGMGIFDRWFGMTYTQIVVSMLVAVFGIVNTLTITITDRRRELGVMQAVGGLRRQIRRTVWIEAIAIGVIGSILGIGLGAVNLYYTLGLAKRDLGGIDLTYIFPVGFALLMLPTIVFAAFVAALGPGESAVRGTLREKLEYE
jgi:putative ABC transport system permease protein